MSLPSYDLHVFHSRTGQPMASVRLSGVDKCLPVELSEHELAVLADVATRSACRVADAEAQEVVET